MVDKKIDDIVDKTLELIEKDQKQSGNMSIYFFNKKEYMKLLIKGEITNTQRKIHDLIEEYQLKENKKLMRRLIELDGNVLKYAGKELRNDKEFVLEAVKQNGVALKYASKELKNDREVVFQARKTIIMKKIEIGRNKR